MMPATPIAPRLLGALMATALAALAWASAPPVCAADPPTLAQRIQRIEDRTAVQDLLMEYGRRLDAGDFHGWAALFATNGVWIGSFGEAQGPAALEAMLDKNMGPASQPKPGAHSVHILTNVLISVQGDHATALSKWSFVQPNAEGRPQAVVVGHYVDQLVREHGAWKFLRREVWGDVPFSDPTAPRPAPRPSP